MQKVNVSEPDQGAASGSVRLVTWNIRAGRRTSPVPPYDADSVDLDHVVAILGSLRADLIALQEVDRHKARSGCVDQLQYIAAALSMESVFAANLMEPGDGEYGTAVLSRYPIVSATHIRFPVYEGCEPRGMQVLDVRAPRETIRILNTHLQVDGYAGRSHADQRRESLRLAADWIDPKMPSLLVGDFNAEPDSPEMGEVLARLIDAGASAGPTIEAHPDLEPTKRIDYILLNDRAPHPRTHVLRTDKTRAASDHFPVVVDLYWEANDAG